MYTKVPLACNVKIPPVGYCGSVNFVTVKGSDSISVSLDRTEFAPPVVVVAVPPSSTVMVSGVPMGVSFTAIIFTKKTSCTVLHPLESSIEIVTVVVPLCSGIYCIVSVLVFKVMFAIDGSSLVNEKLKGFPSASEKLGLKLITLSAASSLTVISGKGISILGQSFIGFILIVTSTSVVVILLSLSL